MKEVLVLGIGNRLMMDDGIGLYVVETLQKQNTNPYIRYIIGETDIYYCLDSIGNASYTIIVDAACLNKEPGTISIIPLKHAFKNHMQLISIHDSHLLNEFELTERNIEGLFVGIEPYEINYSFNLSAILQEQYSKIIEEIENIIEACFNISNSAVIYDTLHNLT